MSGIDENYIMKISFDIGKAEAKSRQRTNTPFISVCQLAKFLDTTLLGFASATITSSSWSGCLLGASEAD